MVNAHIPWALEPVSEPQVLRPSPPTHGHIQQMERKDKVISIKEDIIQSGIARQ